MPLPRISIVTPSFNQAQYLETTLKSVLDAGYPNLEYIVIDGGSTDGSPDIIRQYADRLAYWVSEPDGGHMDAINKGFARSTGEIMGWLNSDDILCRWSLPTVARIFRELPQVQWLTTRTQLLLNAAGESIGALRAPGFSRTWFYRGWHLARQPGFVGYIQQESTFWRRSLWEAAGGHVNAGLDVAGDFELWSRFFEHAELAMTDVPLAGFRVHGQQKTTDIDRYLSVGQQILAPHRAKTIQNQRLVAVLQWLLKITGRGGRRFGSQFVELHYDTIANSWLYSSYYRI